MNRRKLFGAVFIFFLLAVVAESTTLRRMSLDEMTAASAAVVRARCVSVSSRWESGNIWTLTEFEVTESWKGNVTGQVQVRLIGGRVGSLHSKVDGAPRFVPGEEVFLFLAPTHMGDWTVTGWTLGTFRITRDKHSGKETVTQDAGAVTLFDSATRQFHPGGVRRMETNEFRRQVRDAIVRGERRP